MKNVEISKPVKINCNGDNFEIIKRAVLQVTDIATNRNKYYAIELHSTKNKYRVYTHYGRTDDLDSNPNAGMKEARYVDSLGEAEDLYNKIYINIGVKIIFV